jgi:hypothetical protein
MSGGSFLFKKIFLRFYYSFRILCKFHWSKVGEIISCGNLDAGDNGCLSSGREVLESLGMPELSVLPSDVAGLAALVVACHLVSILRIPVFGRKLYGLIFILNFWTNFHPKTADNKIYEYCGQ